MRHRRAVHRSSSNRLTALGLLAAPVLTLALGITLNSSGPQIARASNPLDSGSQAELRPLPERPLPQSQRERIAAIAELEIPNPLYYPPERLNGPEIPVIEPEPVVLDPTPEPELQLPARCVLTAIISYNDGTVRALIDGKIYDAGDDLAPGWTIMSIDPALRLVTLLQPDGKLRSIHMDKN
jgi:hypothetical protein